jgi:hypothetical protein
MQVFTGTVITMALFAPLACHSGDLSRDAQLSVAAEPAARRLGDTLQVSPCEGCDLQLELFTTIGRDFEAPINPEFTLQRLNDGRFVLASMVSGGEMQVLRSDGSYAESFGRSGPGPGEYGWIQTIVVANDHVVVLDPRYRRRTILSDDLAFIRQDPTPSQVYYAAVAADSLLVANMMIMSGEHAGKRLHVVRTDGTIERSLDPTIDGRTAQIAEDFRPLTSRGDDRFYAAHYNEYRIDEWTISGEFIGSFMRSASWFERWTGRCCWVSPTDPPATQLRDLRLDHDGRLWVMITVADSNWVAGLRPSTLDRGAYTVEDPTRAYDAVIEVIDAASGRMLATARFDQTFVGFVGDGLVAAYREDGESPRSLLDVWRLSLPAARSSR